MKHVANEPHGIDMQALLQALPFSGLEPQTVALLTGLTDIQGQYAWQDSVWLLEPPAGQRVSYIEPIAALEKLLRRQGRTLQESQTRAIEAVARMKQNIAQERWVNFLDELDPESHDCLPVPELVAWLRSDVELSVQVAPDVVDFLEQAAEVARRTPMFRGPDNWEELLSMEQMPMLPTPKAMIEFVPGPPWADLDEDEEWNDDANGYDMLYKPFLAWREAIRPVAMALEQALGEPVYCFKELGDDLDDDDVHRFLVLHWCCTYKPQSPFVRYLLQVSKARDVEQLKAALIDPASYTHPFEMNSAFFGMETISCRMDYLPPDRHKTVGFVFLTEKARDVAQVLLPQHIGAHLMIVAPKELLTDAWLAQATRTCRSLGIQYVHNGKISAPIGLLAAVDVLCVIANELSPALGSDLKLAEAVEDLLWQALHLGLKTHFYDVSHRQLVNPETCLQQRGVPERVAARQAQRVAFTRQLNAIRLSSDYGSSGLWDNKGRNLHYDLLDLPFPLVRRIAAWQRDYDDTVTPPDKRSAAWWSRHDQERLALARELQAAVGANTAVSLYRREGWVNVSEIPNTEGDRA